MSLLLFHLALLTAAKQRDFFMQVSRETPRGSHSMLKRMHHSVAIAGAVHGICIWDPRESLWQVPEMHQGGHLHAEANA